MSSDIPQLETEASQDQTVLEASGVTVRFGGVTALNNVDINVPRRAIVGLVGPNGAGKSTLLGVLSGLLPAGGGRVRLAGEEITELGPKARARRGMARTFQQPRLFADLTVRDHLVLGHRMQLLRERSWSDRMLRRKFATADYAERQAVDQLLDLLDLRDYAESSVAGLPLGTSRLIEVGRALSTRPKVLLLDEPSAGLNFHEKDRLSRAFSRVVDEQDVSFVLVEHDVEMVLGLSKAVYVLDFGILIASGTSAEIRVNPEVQAAYLGDAGTKSETDCKVHTVPAVPKASNGVSVAPPLLKVDHLSVSYGEAQALDELSLQAQEGSVVAILGTNGAGKSTFARALSGLVPVSSGKIEFGGQDITGSPAYRIRRLGLAHLPEGRGIFPNLSVNDNLRMAVRTLPRSERAAAEDHAISLFPVLGKRRRQLAGSLSGGEQQMLSLARALALRPRLIVADECSLGLAPLVVDEVFEGLERAQKLGVTVLLIEQFVYRALDLAQYCYILRRGVVAWEGEAVAAGAEVVDHYLGSEEVLQAKPNQDGVGEQISTRDLDDVSVSDG